MFVYNTVDSCTQIYDGVSWACLSGPSSEPWYNVATNTGADSNTQNIYQMGRVSIGESNNPASKLLVYSTDSLPVLTLRGDQRDNATGVKYTGHSHRDFIFADDATDMNISYGYANGTWKTNFGVASNSSFDNNTTFLPRMTIHNGNGNVGIGTTNPQVRLDVDGTGVTAILNSTNSNLFKIAFQDNGITHGHIGASVSTDYSFAVGNADATERQFVVQESTGNVGIGTVNPAVKLHVVTTNGYSGLFEHKTSTPAPTNLWTDPFGGLIVKNSAANSGTDATSGIKFEMSSGSNPQAAILGVKESNVASGLSLWTQNANGSVLERVRVNKDGNVGIGTTAPVHKLDVVGTAGLSTGTSWTNTSDMRLKDGVKPYTRGLTEILKINPIYYSYTEESGLKNDPKYGQNIGISAQELQTIIPEAINVKDHTMKDGSVLKDALELTKADAMWFALINAVKELKAENDALKATLVAKDTALAAKNESLDKRIAMLETLMDQASK